ncbi:hypothetical protein E2562_017025 [Oryza meyeriana var. granulata]|uniref:Presenilin n=1 Tax=Oryza meyeriana var. granulata TaxID=110450 RepID=A0A6G1EBG5_9ORYZ|nr:hypothetical protein E2562_017025 [Oryza meyeriana var. granulata]
MSSSLASSSYRRRIVQFRAIVSHPAYWSRLPARARPPERTRIGAGVLPAATSALGVESSIITVLAMQRWETLSRMVYKSGKLDKAHGKLALKMLDSIVQRSGLDRITHIYCMAAHILVQAKMPSQAMSVLRHLAMTGFSCSAIFSSLLRTISRCDSTNLFSVDLLLNAYVKEGKVLDAVVAIFFMDDCGFKASSFSCNNILSALVGEGKSEYVWLLLKKCLDRKFPLDVTTCNIVLNSLCTQGKFRKAESMLQKMKVCCLPNAVTYNTILNWYVKKGRCKAALRILDDMEKNGIEADLYTYNIMIDKLCKVKRSTRAFLLLKRMREVNITPDKCSYNTLINGFFGEGKINLAIYIFNQMLRESLKPNVATYTALIDGYCRNGRMNEARRVLYEMHITGVRPREVSKAKQILKCMLVDGIDPDVITYSALINEGMIAEAEQFKQYMSRMKISFDVASFNCIIDSYCNRGNVLEAFSVYDNMVRHGWPPNICTYGSLLRGLCQGGHLVQAKEFMVSLLEKPCAIDEKTLNALLVGICKHGTLDEALDLCEKMVTRNFLPDTYTYTILLDGFCKRGQVKAASYMFQEIICKGGLDMVKEGIKPDNVTYRLLILGLSEYGLIDIAAKFLEKMKAGGVAFGGIRNMVAPSEPKGVDDITTALITAVTFVAAVTAATFLLALLFYLRCTPCLRAYLGFSSLSVLLLLGGHVALLLLSRLRFPLDAVSFALLLPNAAAALALAALSPASVPIALHQAALVAIAVLTAFWFTLLPEWTTWALLVAMAVYDLAAVLLPGGPLRVLLELAIQRNEEIPALVYEARPVDPRHGQNWRLWRERQPGGELDANSTVEVIGEVLGRNVDANSAGNLPISATRSDDQVNLVGDARNLSPGETSVHSLSSDSSSGQVTVPPPLPETSVSVAEMRVPLIQPRTERTRVEEDDEDGIGLSSSGAIKLGLGDFIFYSVLVGRAAMYDYMTVYACYLAIIAGLGITLLLLAFYRRALPALPVSIALDTNLDHVAFFFSEGVYVIGILEDTLGVQLSWVELEV